MIDKITTFFIGKANAQNFDIFHPFDVPDPGDDAKGTFTTLVGTVITWVLMVVAIIAFIYLIISGVNYITAGGDAEKATKARTGIINAIIGIVVVVLAYFILQFATSLGNNLGSGA